MTFVLAPGARRWLAGLAGTLAVVTLACGDTAVSPESEVVGSGQVQFTDVGSDVGLDFQHGAFRWSVTMDPPAMMGGGVCWLDYDGDGWLDLFVVNTWSDGEWHRWKDEGALPATRLYRNEQGWFKDVSETMGAGIEVRGNGCVAADLDRDGFTDLYVTTERANVMLWNEAGEAFAVDDGSAGINSYGWHTGAAVGDVNDDGWPDLFVAGYADLNRPIPGATRGFPNTIEATSDLLLLSQGAEPGRRPVFIDVASEVGIEPGGIDYGLGAVFSDIDQDGDLDLYVANDTQPNRLYTNESASRGHRFRLTDKAAEGGVDDDDAGMGVAAADYDTDGRPDLVVTNMATQGHNVFSSQGRNKPLFSSDVDKLGLSEIGQTHTGWGTAWADLDLDGYLDLVIAQGSIPVSDLVADRQPVEVYLQQAPDLGQSTFVKVEPLLSGGGDADYLARGLAAADYDNDGDVDLAVTTIGGEIALLRNDGTRQGWLTVVAEPPIPGTMITVTSGDGRVQYREILAGSSYLSSEDPRAHFGLEDSEQSATVEVRWPDGSTGGATVDDTDRLVVVRPD